MVSRNGLLGLMGYGVDRGGLDWFCGLGSAVMLEIALGDFIEKHKLLGMGRHELDVFLGQTLDALRPIEQADRKSVV